MRALGRLFLLQACFTFGCVLFSAPPLGQLVYANRVGRAISLKVTEASPGGLLSLQRETGAAETFRLFVLAHAGQEHLAARGAQPLSEKAPASWRVQWNRGGRLLKTTPILYWQYSSNWVLPVGFPLLGQDWRLISADLPGRGFAPIPPLGIR